MIKLIWIANVFVVLSMTIGCTKREQIHEKTQTQPEVKALNELHLEWAKTIEEQTKGLMRTPTINSIQQQYLQLDINNWY